MRDRRYLLTRRWHDLHRRTDVRGFAALDQAQRLYEQSNRRFERADRTSRRFFLAMMGVLVVMLFALSIYTYTRPPPAPEPSSYQVARDEAAQERARDFVRGLDFEPGLAVCRAKRDGSAWCTIRVAGSEKTFVLWCSDEHPTCNEHSGMD